MIVPVVFYHGAATWSVSPPFADGVTAVPALLDDVPHGVYHRVDLSGYRDEDRRGAVMRQVALLTLKYIFRRELGERLLGILRLLRDLEQSSSGLDFIRALLQYLAQVVGTDRLSEADFRQAVTPALSGGGELMMTIAEQWVQKGRQEGLFSERQLLLRLVRRRFGEAWLARRA